MTIKEFEERYCTQMAEYGIVLADPPWNYNNQGTRAATKNHYENMPLNDIKRLPVDKICNMPSVLFLWATWPNIKQAFAVIDAWGFEYKTLAWEWRKTNKAGDKYIMGLGNYSRSNPEPCLLAFRKVKTKGKAIKVADHSVPAWMDAPRRKHSQKPDLQYEYIDRLYPDLPRIELFARQTWPGWDSWGNEVEGAVELW